MNDVRVAFLEAAGALADLLGLRQVGDKWDDDSTLAGFTIGALAGHAARGVLTVYWYLDMPEPDPPTITAAEYFAPHPSAFDTPVNVQVRERGADTAKGGWARLYLDVGRAVSHLEERLQTEPAEHRIPALGKAILLDEYLRTRLVELVVHLGDLSRSLDLPTPELVAPARFAIELLIDTAVERHGQAAVLHALARRELDTLEALKVL